MSTDDRDTSRTAVKTYVPAYQKSEWERHAEELDMSQSEFVRTMVQAGRRGFGSESAADRRPETEDASEASDPESDDLAARIEDALDAEECLTWEELLSHVTDDVEQRLDAAMQRLQRQNRIQYDGRRGGYTLLEDHGE